MKLNLYSRFFALTIILGFSLSSYGTIHVIQVWDGYYQFVPNTLTITLGDTIEWRKLDEPMMTHTITSTNIPAGAASFDVIWQLPADTFFQYVPTHAGLYEYECTPHVTSYNMVGNFTVAAPLATPDPGEQEVMIGPNPVSERLNLKAPDHYTGFSIHSLNGKLLKTGPLREEIDVAELSAGTYILRLEGDKPRALRFVKE